MYAKEEVGESSAHVVYNGNASRINEIGLQLYQVSEYDFGEGLPYASVDWPNPGDKWCWRVGKKSNKFSWMIPSKQLPSSKDIDFDSDMKERTTSSGTELHSLLSDPLIRAITCKVGNKICSSLTTKNPFPAILCDICCIEPGFCRDCCCILCRNTISSDYDGYNYIRFGGSINLDALYLCRYCDSRMDLFPHALKLLNTCTSVSSRADIENILNVGICILRGSQKRSGKKLLHRIESIKAKNDQFDNHISLRKESAFKIHPERKAVWIALSTTL
ncbi:hypothetical protein KY284_036354 [Solanum tuberosum]|nr:hypothetical protein KY284_036354 [Solanum tuberosum]